MTFDIKISTFVSKSKKNTNSLIIVIKDNKMMKNKSQKKTVIVTSPIESSKVIREQKPVNGFAFNSKIAIGILAMAVIVAFAAGFSNKFLYNQAFDWDDGFYAANNPLIQNPTFSNLFKLLKQEIAVNYHPLTMASLWLNSRLFGNSAASFIITNTFIHVINTILVFLITKKLLQKTTHNTIILAFFVALLWGVHPMHVESVIWVAERKDVLYVCFFLLSCLQYVKFLENSNRKYLIYCFVFFLLSCLAKGMAVVLPLALIAFDYWFDGTWSFQKVLKNIKPKIPFFLLALGFGLLAIHVQSGGSLGGLIERTTNDSAIDSRFSFFNKLCFGFYGFLVYLFKFFIPIQLRNFYAYPESSLNYSFKFVIAPIIAFIVLAGAFMLRNRRKEVFFGIFFFFFTIVTVLQFITVGGAILAERYSYLPYFGLTFMFVYGLSSKLSLKNLVGTLSIIGVIFMFLTFRYVQLYKDGGTLFENSYQYEPKSVRINENLLKYYSNQTSYLKAIDYGEKAVKSGAASYNVLHDLANSYFYAQNFEKAIFYYNAALSLSPPAAIKGIIYSNMGKMHNYTKQYTEAAADFDKAMQADNSLLQKFIFSKASNESLAKNYKQAIKDYTRSIELGVQPLDLGYNNRAVARQTIGDRARAIEDYQQALKINPNSKIARGNLIGLGVLQDSQSVGEKQDIEETYLLAYALFNKGKVAEARKKANEVLAVNPNHAGILSLLGIMADEEKSYTKAIEYYNKSIAINPNNAKNYFNLGNTYSNIGKTDEAIVQYEKAINTNPLYTRAYLAIINAYKNQGNSSKAKYYQEKLNQLEK
jgi:tetratricopeptide (TPR) repeat protein